MMTIVPISEGIHAAFGECVECGVLNSLSCNPAVGIMMVIIFRSMFPATRLGRKAKSPFTSNMAHSGKITMAPALMGLIMTMGIARSGLTLRILALAAASMTTGSVHERGQTQSLSLSLLLLLESSCTLIVPTVHVKESALYMACTREARTAVVKPHSLIIKSIPFKNGCSLSTS